MAFKKIAIYMMMAAMSLPVIAQELDETFSIKGEYDTKINKQERIAQLPSSLELKVNNPGLQYSATGVPVNVSSYLTPLTALGWEDTYKYDTSRGYLDLGMGSYLDIVGSAGYRFVDTQHTTFGIRLQHTSSSAFNPFKDRDPKPASRKLFDEYVGLYGSHTLDGVGRIDASLNYRLGYFNYYGLLQGESALDQPSQTTNSLDVAARFTADPAKLIQWNAGVEYNYFGYRRFYLNDGAELPGLKQNLLSINGGASYPFSSNSNLRHDIGMDLRADFVMFASQHPEGIAMPDLKSYSRFCLAPRYRFDNGSFSGRLGAKIDLMANIAPASSFRIAPDVYAGYRGGRFGIGLQLGGGVELNTLQRNAALDRYSAPWLYANAPIYSPIDGKIAIDLGSFKGLSASLAFAYKVTNDQPLAGHYMQYLAMPVASALNDFAAMDIHGYSLQAGLRYAYSRYFEVSADMAYQPQNDETGYFNGLDRPRWLLDAKLGVTPIKGLKIDLQYQYRGVRKLYGHEYNPTQPGLEYTYLRLPDVTDLSLGASYAVLPDLLTLWVRADNLLGTDAYLNPMLPTPGLSIIGGVALKF